MTNTYPEDATISVKTYEEMRCIRCIMERFLMAYDSSAFKDYQLEKFSGSSEAREIARKNK